MSSKLTPAQIRTALNRAISETAQLKQLFSKDPHTNFTRERKDHWDVQNPKGDSYVNVYPDGRQRVGKGKNPPSITPRNRTPIPTTIPTPSPSTTPGPSPRANDSLLQPMPVPSTISIPGEMKSNGINQST